ncbi:LacI family DNA-binding transcriptional regulator [Aureimonas frigidaquae]|uniref:Putative transcriptional regulator lacI family n=1 Tax=Aureimonas frigidaquae TaxID=424757 RepID=A0A0P0Z2J7_9HYPH|nr:LacI family DNA-binding transcriptional regulator [Aureimonas frigidaquae]BAT28191.1 putative transcriptional regulator lacI family [Aureimonas frigidaquae]
MGQKLEIEPDRMKPDKKYASSTDVARLAGVSQSAVSRTFRPGASVSAETRRKVLAAAAELGYTPSLIPRIMLTQRSHLVAIVFGGLYNPFYSSVLELFTARLQEEGWQVLLVHVDSGHSFDDVVPKLSSYRVDAIVSALALLSAEAVALLESLRIPVISFNTPVRNAWISSVSCDNFGAAELMARHMHERGARRFAYVSGPVNSPANIDRRQGFEAGLRALGLPMPVVAEGDFRYESGRAATERLLSEGADFDALFCANDLLALGALDALRAHGRSVPQDVMVAGFDDIPAASWGAYELTTLVHDGERMVDTSISILHAATNMPPDPHDMSVTVPARLIARRTTDRRPAG